MYLANVRRRVPNHLLADDSEGLLVPLTDDLTSPALMYGYDTVRNVLNNQTFRDNLLSNLSFTTYGLNDIERQPSPLIYQSIIDTIDRYYGLWVVDAEELYEAFLALMPQFVMMTTLQVLLTLDDILRNRYADTNDSASSSVSTGSATTTGQGDSTSSSTGSDKEILTSESSNTGSAQDVSNTSSVSNDYQKATAGTDNGLTTSASDSNEGFSNTVNFTDKTGGVSTNMVLPLPELFLADGSFPEDSQGTPQLLAAQSGSGAMTNFATSATQSNQTMNEINNTVDASTSNTGTGTNNGYDKNESVSGAQSGSNASQTGSSQSIVQDDAIGVNTLRANTDSSTTVSSTDSGSSTSDSLSSNLSKSNTSGYTTSAMVGSNYNQLLQAYLGMNVYNWLIEQFAWVKGFI